jgi:hypothetical protein
MAERKYDFTSPATRALRRLAWFNLACGVAGAIGVWLEIGWRYEKGSSYSTEANPAGIIFGLMVLIVGITACAFLLVVCDVAESISKIENEVERLPKEG